MEIGTVISKIAFKNVSMKFDTKNQPKSNTRKQEVFEQLNIRQSLYETPRVEKTWLP